MKRQFRVDIESSCSITKLSGSRGVDRVPSFYTLYGQEVVYLSVESFDGG